MKYWILLLLPLLLSCSRFKQVEKRKYKEHSVTTVQEDIEVPGFDWSLELPPVQVVDDTLRFTDPVSGATATKYRDKESGKDKIIFQVPARSATKKTVTETETEGVEKNKDIQVKSQPWLWWLGIALVILIALFVVYKVFL